VLACFDRALRAAAAVEVFEQGKVFDLTPHRSDAPCGVVIGERNHAQATAIGGLQDLQIGRVKVLIIGGVRCVDMQIHTDGMQFRLLAPLVTVSSSPTPSS